MADLSEILPDLDLKPYSHLLHSLEKNDIIVSDLITLDPIEIARRCPLPLMDLRRLVKDVIEALQNDLNISRKEQRSDSDPFESTLGKSDKEAASRNAGFFSNADRVMTLDTALDKAFGGGFLPGHITEIVGER